MYCACPHTADVCTAVPCQLPARPRIPCLMVPFLPTPSPSKSLPASPSTAPSTLSTIDVLCDGLFEHGLNCWSTCFACSMFSRKATVKRRVQSMVVIHNAWMFDSRAGVFGELRIKPLWFSQLAPARLSLGIRTQG